LPKPLGRDLSILCIVQAPQDLRWLSCVAGV
jgi:hypothetical protein